VGESSLAVNRWGLTFGKVWPMMINHLGTAPLVMLGKSREKKSHRQDFAHTGDG
jgi:hypothetical protein